MEQTFLTEFIERYARFIFAELDTAIELSGHHSPTANHFYRLKKRLLSGKKLTKKMEQNLGWILKDVNRKIKIWYGDN